MTSRFIGINDFLQFITKAGSRRKKKNERLILLHKNKAVFELLPLSKKDAIEQKLMADIQEAEDDVKAGRVYTHEQVKKMFHIE